MLQSNADLFRLSTDDQVTIMLQSIANNKFLALTKQGERQTLEAIRTQCTEEDRCRFNIRDKHGENMALPSCKYDENGQYLNLDHGEKTHV